MILDKIIEVVKEEKQPKWKPSTVYSLKRDAMWNPFIKFERNHPCICRSQKKYKKCCLPKMPRAIPIPSFAKNKEQ
jgi:uncharacterized protein YecA (UPF0149 family)